VKENDAVPTEIEVLEVVLKWKQKRRPPIDDLLWLQLFEILARYAGSRSNLIRLSVFQKNNPFPPKQKIQPVIERSLRVKR
jgi:hypothetical protein